MRNSTRIRLSIVSAMAMLSPLLIATAVGEYAGEALSIDFKSGDVTESSGVPLDIQWIDEDPALMIGTAPVSNGETAVITKQSALPVSADIYDAPRATVRPEDEGSTLIETRNAGTSGIAITEASSTSSYAQARVSHDVANPFCIAGSNQYNVIFRWYRNGTFEVVGWRRPVPHHEIYGGWDPGNGIVNWHPFGRFSNEGFECLAGVCGTRDMYITRTH